jgi:23S rRNA (cytosine1962-C5)-methyltransferase
MTLPVLTLKKNEDRRLKAGHLWIFSNEVATEKTPLNQFEPGQAVLIENSQGKVIGSGYVNPHSLICARLISRDPKYVLDKSLITHRLNIALSLRDRLFNKPFYRLVYGESDGLPGLIVDRFDDILSVQINTAGMERVKTDIVAALEKVIKPKAILMRNDSNARALEGLDSYIETVVGDIPDLIPVEENNTRFEVSLATGQKTGWFFDHAKNRLRTLDYVKDKRVLDVFSYVGAWGIQAANAGAAEVVCIESSDKAIELIHHNAEINALQQKVKTLQGDAFEALKILRNERDKFDVVILDPPAFIKRKKDIKEGLIAYRRLNQAALQLISNDGILISASCSHHLHRDNLLSVIHEAGRHIDRQLQILEQGHQSPDHPIHPAIPETDYLKAFFVRVLYP